MLFWKEILRITIPDATQYDTKNKKQKEKKTKRSKQAPPPARVSKETMELAKDTLRLMEALPESEEKDLLLKHKQTKEGNEKERHNTIPIPISMVG